MILSTIFEKPGLSNSEREALLNEVFSNADIWSKKAIKFTLLFKELCDDAGWEFSKESLQRNGTFVGLAVAYANPKWFSEDTHNKLTDWLQHLPGLRPFDKEIKFDNTGVLTAAEQHDVYTLPMILNLMH